MSVARDRLLAENTESVRTGHEPARRRYVRRAVEMHTDLESAATWLAVWVANECASDPADRARSTLVEAYRRVRRAADAEQTETEART